MKETKKKTSRDKLLDVTFEEVYRVGYCGAGTATILKKAEVPKGSMYHHFPSKQAMVLAMIEERLVPKVREFFDFEFKKEHMATDILSHTLKKISENRMLVTYGCPLHRLMFEMGSQNEAIALACQKEFEHLTQNLAKVLEFGMREGSIKKGDALNMAEFVIASTWGFLSRPINASSSEIFLQDSQYLLESIQK